MLVHPFTSWEAVNGQLNLLVLMLLINTYPRLGNYRGKRLNELTVPHGWGGLTITAEDKGRAKGYLA